MRRVLGVLANVVPYHHARWDAYARLGVAECHVLEATDRDEFKVLEFSSTAAYGRHTLFPASRADPISRRALCRKMLNMLDDIQPEAVCLSGWHQPGSLTALRWAVRNAVPAVMLSESNRFDEARSAAKEHLKQRIIGLCSAGLAGGTPQAEYLGMLGLPRERIFLGYDAVDNQYFGRKAEEVRNAECGVRTRYGLPERYFLASARFTEKKNLPRLIQAYASYRQKAESRPVLRSSTAEGGKQTPDIWDLVLLGDGPLREALNAQVSTLNLHGHLHMPGAKPYSSLPTYYGLASAFVHASTTEQWGLVVNEAMASGLPVLVSNRCGCALDLVQEGVNGFTFDPYNTERLADAMVRLWRMEDGELNRMADAGQRIIANWGPDRFAAGLNAAVDCALAVGPKRASLLDCLLLRLLLLR